MKVHTLITSIARSTVGTTFALTLISEINLTHQIPVAWLLVACASLTVLGGLGSYFKERGEKRWSTKGVITTVMLMTTIGVSLGAGLSVLCEFYEVPNLLVVMVCGLIGVFGIDFIEKLPDILPKIAKVAPLLRALKTAILTFIIESKKGKDDDTKKE